MSLVIVNNYCHQTVTTTHAALLSQHVLPTITMWSKPQNYNYCTLLTGRSLGKHFPDQDLKSEVRVQPGTSSPQMSSHHHPVWYAAIWLSTA